MEGHPPSVENREKIPRADDRKDCPPVFVSRHTVQPSFFPPTTTTSSNHRRHHLLPPPSGPSSRPRATMSRRAVIVSTARTGLTKSFRSGFNNTHGAVMQGHAIKHAIEKAGISPGDVEDVIIGCGFPEGATGMNIARNAALWAGCPVTTSGTTINRFCSSGLQAVASAAHSVMVDGVDVAIGGGVESISMVSPVASKTTVTEEKLMSEFPALWMPMIETADIVSAR